MSNCLRLKTNEDSLLEHLLYPRTRTALKVLKLLSSCMLEVRTALDLYLNVRTAIVLRDLVERTALGVNA